ncbi:MAG: hypothetical protein CL928_06175 [Deltaproteobacteria bacterium]|nr:hypothetical protein [Deltaproteobacteria bacterium]|tara:strand:+ start:532 stop:948 length:417 start_codon:yes stop_codon:yes gene_type:complete
MKFTRRLLSIAGTLALSTALASVTFAGEPAESAEPTEPAEPAKLAETPEQSPAKVTAATEAPTSSYDFNRIKKTRDLSLKVGQKALINLGAVRNYGVQDDQVVRLASHPDGDKIVVIAKTPGVTTVGVGRIGFAVTVQ